MNSVSLLSLFVVFFLLITGARSEQQLDAKIPVKSTTLPPTVGPQYSGLLEVNQTFNGKLFYWFFQTKDQSAPIIVWLEGGPGIPGSFQVFYGMGPYRITTLGEVSLNEDTWNNQFNLLFFDNPLGVGFSSVNEGGNAVNEEEVASTLYSGLTQFLELYPQFQSNDIYIFGESYGGKYVPSLSYFINYMQELKNQNGEANIKEDEKELEKSFKRAALKYYQSNTAQNIQINLKGIGIGDGLVDTPVQIQTIADFAYFHGLSSLQQRENLTKAQEQFQTFYNNGKYEQASNVFWDLLYFIQYKDRVNFYNVDCSISCGFSSYLWGGYSRFLDQESVKEQLNVPTNYTFNSQSRYASAALNSDVCKSVSDLMPTLFSNYKTLLYQGTLDLICNAVGNDLWLASSEWSAMKEFQTTPKSIWLDGIDVAGYVRTYSNLTQIFLPNAGHFVTLDQPARANLMINNWVNDTPFQTPKFE